MRSLVRLLRRHFSGLQKCKIATSSLQRDEPPTRKTLETLRTLHASSTPITVLTAYDYPTALHADRAGVDVTLVGDSLGMVCLGHATTQSVTMDQMVHHAQAARRGTQSALLVADLPFGSYEASIDQAINSAMRLVKEAGVDAIKLEGGVNRAAAVKGIVDAGIAVMGHVGLLPQAVSRIGAFRATGRSCEEAQEVVLDALALQHAGAFAIVVECVPSRVAQLVTSSVSIPTIGIGSGSVCDGQVLVYHDLLRILSHPHHDNVAPKFSKAFGQVGIAIDNALRMYCQEVRSREFPDRKHSPYLISDEEFKKLQSFVDSLREVSDSEVRGKNSVHNLRSDSGFSNPIKVY